jgi:hypothetical protein
LVNTFEKYLHPVNSLPGVIQINNIVPIKHGPGGMTGHGHDHRLGNAGFAHVGVEGVPQVVEYETIFLKLRDILNYLIKITKHSVF